MLEWGLGLRGEQRMRDDMAPGMGLSSEYEKPASQKFKGFVGLWTETEWPRGPETACGMQVERGAPPFPHGTFCVPASNTPAKEEGLLTQQGLCWVGSVGTGMA